MKRQTLPLLVALLVTLPGLATAQSTEAQRNQSSPPAMTPPSPTPAPRPHDDIVKLWKAKLSEDFIKKQIDAAPVPYNLTADEIILVRDAGVPENLIQAMIQASAKATAPAAPTAGGAQVPVAGAPTAAPSPVPAYAAQANRKWEGLVRRNSGVVLLKSRWDVGTLEFKEETFRWTDAKDASKNLMIPGRQFAEQFLTCLKKAGGNECFEWGFKTRDDVYRFRDVSWHQGENAKTKELADFFKAIYPNLILSDVAVDSK